MKNQNKPNKKSDPTNPCVVLLIVGKNERNRSKMCGK
jgi:hypothetical protein